MVTTLTGSNGYILKEKLDSLTNEFKRSNDHLAIERISVDEIDFDDFKQSLLSSSLFSENRLVILDQPSSSKQFIELAEEIINSIPDSTHLIIIEPTLDKRSTYYKLLQKTNFIDCSALKESDLVKWAKAKVKESGGLINDSDVSYLIERVGEDQLLIDHEIEKLLIYNNQIDRETINLLTVESPSNTIFHLLDAVFAKRLKSALSIYDTQRKLKVAPEQILAMFVWQLQIISVCLSAKGTSTSELASKSKLSPYSLNNAMKIARNLNLTTLRDLISNLLDIDYLSKTISYDLDQALQNFIIEAATSF